MDDRERAAWLEERTKGLGGTDVAAIVVDGAEKNEKGGCFGRSTFSIWAEKTKRVQPEPGALNEAMLRGQLLEDYVCGLYRRKIGKGAKLTAAGLPWHPEGIPIFGTPDRLVDIGENKGGMDAKTRRYKTGWGSDGTSAVPLDVEVQMRVYMEVFDRDWWDIAVLFGFDMRIMKLKRDKQLGQDILGAATDWWKKHVEEDEPPTPDGATSTREVLQRMYTAKEDCMIRSATADEIDLHRELLKIRQEHKDISDRKTELENQLRHAIGSDEGIDGVATWKWATPRSKFASKTFKKEMPDIYEKFTIEVEGNRTLRILGE